MTRWLLDVQGLDVTVGTVPVLHGVGVQLDQGRAVAVVGANGAGKSTLLRTIMGLLRPDAGRIHLAGMPLDALRADQRARAGIGYCPEGRRVFPGLTVIENLQVASWEKRMSRQARLREIFELFPPLGVRRRSLGWELSGGQQQMLAIGRSLMNRPRVLLLDEPCLGLSPKLAAEVSACIAVISGSGTAVLLAEQSPARALAVCDSAIVLKSGRVVASGAAAMLRDGDAIRDAVLGR